jgi:sugar phosphate isomerase/epimerase
MTTPVSVQLYSLRTAVTEIGLPAVIERVGAMGYAAVEPAGLSGMSPAEFRRRVEDLGMVVSSFHQPWAKPENLAEVVSTCRDFGLDLACSGYGPPFFADLAAIRSTAATVNSMIKSLAADGIRLFLHNHWWEFIPVEGRLAHEWLMELCPDLLVEVDTYWAANFGACDPAAQVRRCAARAPLLHIKDGPLVKDAAHVAVGSGKMDIPAVVAAADPAVLRYLVVELDKCDTDIFAAVQGSLDYLVAAKLGHGRGGTKGKGKGKGKGKTKG